MDTWKIRLACLQTANSSAGEHLYQSVRDICYDRIRIELPGVQFGGSRRDRTRCSAIRQFVREVVHSNAPLVCYGEKGA
eukprot:1373536-Lingulodinium_polyedra.AAC.1